MKLTRLHILICLAFGWLTPAVKAQEGVEVLSNTVPQAAVCIPSSFIRFNMTNSVSCIEGKTQLYYKFYIQADSTGGNPNVGTWSLNGGGTFTYILYGPFTDEQGAADQVETNSAPIAGLSFDAATSSPTFLFDVHKGEFYILALQLDVCSGTIVLTDVPDALITCSPVATLKCKDCLGKFQPSPGQYVFSSWAKREAGTGTITATINTDDGTVYSFNPSGPVIDDWQQITGIFNVPEGMSEFKLTFSVTSGSALFDDIRMFPNDGSMMSYVYDPVTLRLVAELDERNYAKLYEYDQEGKLVRVKKETINGVMTITENRENSVKKP